MHSVANLVSDFSMLEYLREQESSDMHKLNMTPFLSSLGHTFYSTECELMNVSEEVTSLVRQIKFPKKQNAEEK